MKKLYLLIYSPFAFVTALCDLLRGPGHLFVPFSTYYNYLCVILVCFWVYCWGAHPFFVLGSLTSSSSVRIKSGKFESLPVVSFTSGLVLLLRYQELLLILLQPAHGNMSVYCFSKEPVCNISVGASADQQHYYSQCLSITQTLHS
jgi:hypothetical protein